MLWTDGVPDQPGAFKAALRELRALPVLIVVRLCTSDLLDFDST